MVRWDEPAHKRAPRPRIVHARPGESPRFEDAVEAMLALSGWSIRSQSTARTNLLGGRFADYRRRHGIVSIADLTTLHAAEFIAAYRNGHQPATVRKFRAHLRALERFCERTPGYGSGLKDVGAAIPAPRVARKDRPVLTPTDEATLLAACESERDRLILLVLVATGIRVSELVALTLADCHLDARLPYLSVSKTAHGPMTKNAEDRWAPLPHRLAKRLDDWIANARPQTPRGELFLTVRGRKGGVPGPMTIDGVEAVFERLQARTGVYCRPHLCRHTWATRSANAGVPLFQLMVAGGWSSPELVRLYYSGDRVSMLEAFSKLANA